MKGFVTSGICSTHFIVTLAGLKNIIRYTGDFVTKGFVTPEFCNFDRVEEYHMLVYTIQVNSAFRAF